MSKKKNRKAIFTICSNNYLPYAKILLNSLQKHHQDVQLFLCLADHKVNSEKVYVQGVSIIEARDLNVPNFDDFAFRYDIMEFNTALKPFMMSLLVEEYDFEQVIYLDPDIEVFAPLDDIFDALESGQNFVLTPHLTAPSEINTYPNDIDIMKAGIYNLGFIGVSNHEDVIAFLHWWGRRLRFECINRQDKGIFVDQKFVDLVPAFYENVQIIRNPGLNVAYWNLHQRKLTYYEEKGTWFVNGKPLIFFHFSGINPRNRQRLSKHTESFKSDLDFPLQKIVDHYIDEYYLNIQETCFPKDYHYNYFDNGTSITDIIRKYYRNRESSWIDNPFTTFHDYLNQTNLTALEKSGVAITNMMYALWLFRADLQQAFRLDSPESLKSYTYWFIQFAFTSKVDNYFIKPVLDSISDLQSLNCKHRLANLNQSQPDLIGLIGYLKAETGVGQAGRSVAKSLAEINISVSGLDVDINVVTRRDDNSTENILKEKINCPIHLLHVNADQLAIVKDHISSSINKAKYKICMPYWELSIFPSEWVKNFNNIDEVWVGSEFVRASLQAKLSVPVISLPPAVSLGEFQIRKRSYFELPENTFLFHFNFDFSSYSSRKNPEAVITAYRTAFRKKIGGDSTALVIKVRGYDPDNQQYQELMALAKAEKDIIVINKQLSHGDSIALMNCCDCYVSLHRSEGFGYTLAEAMLLGKPVIATHFSGSNEFINRSTAFPILYQLVPLVNDDYPFYENQCWAQVDIEHAAWTMQQIIGDIENTNRIAYSGMAFIKDNHSFRAAGDRYLRRLQQLGLT
jgi:glycosyltransferase involved in cell wall biosynthesis